jgi:hypothetical protein
MEEGIVKWFSDQKRIWFHRAGFRHENQSIRILHEQTATGTIY